MNLAALYVYSAIVGWIFATGIGLPPIPEEVAVMGLGVWIHKNPDALLVICWLVCLGAVLGTDLLLYSVGRFGGPVLMSKPYVQKFLKPERVQNFAHKFQDRGIWFMLTARFIPGWRSAVFITAGVIQYPVARFVFADAISSVPLVTFFFFGGYYAADTINAIIRNIHQAQYVLLLLALVAALIVGAILYIRWVRAQEKVEAAEEAIEHVKMEEAQYQAHVPAGAVAEVATPVPIVPTVSGTEATIRPQP